MNFFRISMKNMKKKPRTKDHENKMTLSAAVGIITDTNSFSQIDLPYLNVKYEKCEKRKVANYE